MPPVTLDHVQHDLLNTLPEAMQRALQSYTSYITQPIEHDPKQYAAHHAGGKAALSHLEALLKLAKWVMAEQQSVKGPADRAEALENLIQQAQQALKQDGDI